ncbi:MAG: hypothetical protein IJO46_05460, partial [Thermoguttaceae bacterium]|nr:hypothetical protein [Thermoguttaceae bacterium]
LLPAGMFARERQTKEIACLQRFPIPLQTVVAAKFSAALVLTTLVAAAFVLIGLGFDLLYGYEPFSALNAFCSQFEPREIANLRAFTLSPFELLIWGVFWATRIRREAFVVAASLLSTFAVWALVGWVVAFGKEAPGSLAVANTWVLTRDTSVGSLVTVGGVASVGSPVYAALRFGALLLPIVGIVRAFRRDGAQTTLGNGLDGLYFRFKTLLTKRRRPDATATPAASVPVDSNTSATLGERSTSVSSRLVDLTPRRLRPLTALCVETVESASLFGRFRGAVLIDLAIVDGLYFLLSSPVNRNKDFAPALSLLALLFITLFASGAFAGLRRDRLILATRFPVSPRLYYASQLLTYVGLYVAALLPIFCLRRPSPELNFVGAYFSAHFWFVAFCASAIVRSRIGAALACVLYYAATFSILILGKTPREANQALFFLLPLIAGVASYFVVVRRFKRGRN